MEAANKRAHVAEEETNKRVQEAENRARLAEEHLNTVQRDLEKQVSEPNQLVVNLEGRIKESNAKEKKMSELLEENVSVGPSSWKHCHW